MALYLLVKQKENCVVPEKIHTHPMEGHWKFLGGGEVLKAKCLDRSNLWKWTGISGGGGGQNKNLPWGGSMDISRNYTFDITSSVT